MTDTLKGMIITAASIVTVICSLIWAIAWYNKSTEAKRIENGYVEAFVPSAVTYTYSHVWVKSNMVNSTSIPTPLR